MKGYRSAKGLVRTVVCLIACSACKTSTFEENGYRMNETDTIVDGDDFNGSSVIEWQEEIASTEDTPDLTNAGVQMYIPNGVTEVRGVLVFSQIGVGGEEYEHEVWRTSAATTGYALMKISLSDTPDRVAPWEFPEQSARFLYRIFDTMAQRSGHPELSTSPFFFFGHSAGGFWFTRLVPQVSERTVGFIAFHGSLSCDELFYPSTLSIPGLFLIAEYDPSWIRDDTVEIVSAGLEKGALWSLVVDPDAGHWDVDPGRQLMVEFVETVFRHRVPSADGSGGAEISLVDFPAKNLWWGQLEHYSVYNGDEAAPDWGKEVITHASISPRPAETMLSSGEQRLISPAFAKSWLAYELSGVESIAAE